MHKNNKVYQINPLLFRCLFSPDTVRYFSNLEWESLICSTRSAKLLAYIGKRLDKQGERSNIPEKVQENFDAAQKLIDFRKTLVLWEINRLQKVLKSLDFDVVVLKGGAYLLLHLPFAESRLIADVDILVDERNIKAVESRLIEENWVTFDLDEYDNHYYRDWMHEIPPMRHKQRHIEVDVHHTILPLTCRLKPDANLMIRDAVYIEESAFKVLSPCDLVLHSVVHLFYNGELGQSDFRDLIDLDELFRYYGGENSQFWDEIKERAAQHQLQRPLFYSLHYTHMILNTPVPRHALHCQGRPNYLMLKVMDYLVLHSLIPVSPFSVNHKIRLARWLLFMRSHYIKMPLFMLIKHLLKKGKKRLGREKSPV